MRTLERLHNDSINIQYQELALQIDLLSVNLYQAEKAGASFLEVENAKDEILRLMDDLHDMETMDTWGSPF